MKRKIWFGVVIILVVLVGLMIVYMERATVYAQLDALHLIPQQERFTELYFENSASLPKQTIAGQPARFAFTIHNLEGASTVYPYSVYLRYPNAPQTVFATGMVTLADGSSKTIQEAPVFKASNQQVTVVVALTSLNQQIDFIMPNTNN